ncbi:MAG: hypothetical protein OXP09_18670 [Gammaproteobacteria bacterium]|nr:hypothetical protein [Gammaproteobacteria bacterium]MDE0367587.1 hypothetical protein [Gammaproteobacteria bacterium]
MLKCQLPDPDPISDRPSRFSHIVLQTNGSFRDTHEGQPMIMPRQFRAAEEN